MRGAETTNHLEISLMESGLESAGGRPERRHAFSWRDARLVAVSVSCMLFASACSTNPDQQPDAGQVADAGSASVAPYADMASAVPHAGAALYQANCASCHDNAQLANAPGRDTLKRMSAGQIAHSMVQGKMIAQAAALSSEEISVVADYISEAETVGDGWIDTMMCPTERRTPNLSSAPNVAGFGFDLTNTRNLSYEQAGLVADDIADLELAWAVAFPLTASLRGQAAVVGSTVFLPVGESDNRLFAFDISDTAEPCIQWVYQGGAALFRSSAAYGVRPDGRRVVMVSDLGANTHMVDALTGEKLWVSRFGLFDNSMGTGTPVLVEDMVIAPSSQYEITQGGYDVHLCCRSHGGVVALDAMTGDRVWEAHTMPDAEPLYDRGDGQMLWGPSGAPIWNSPAIDLERRQIYVGTGESNSPPAHESTDAILAIDLDDGSIKWMYQALADDIWIVHCAPGGEPRPGATRLNCVPDSQTVYLDFDFGASTILATTPSGRDLLIAGQKSGDVYALDPDTGDLVWRAFPGGGGMINWGMSIDDTHVYVPLNSFGLEPEEPGGPRIRTHGVYALNLETGEIDWTFATEPYCTDERRAFVPSCERSYGLNAPTTIVGDHVFAGTLDGRLYALDRRTGEVDWSYDAARSFETVNGVPGNGGTFGNNAAIAANGMIIANSGYGVWGIGPGNVMLGFRPRE